MHDLCVIVVSHNGKRWLDRALSSLDRHTGPIDLDVVVVDNGSDGAGEYACARFPFVRSLRCENRGFAHANNRALETADARYVLFLNPDTEIVEGRLSDLLATLDQRPGIGLAGARQLGPDGGLEPTIRRFPALRHTLAESLGVEHVPLLRRFLGERELDPARYERETPCDWTSGSFMLVRGTALEMIGWLDERYFLFSEETDLCRRLWRGGWQVVHLPTMTIRHDGSEGGVSCALEAQNAYGRMQFARKHFSWPGRQAYRVALAFRYLLRVTLYSTLRRSDSERRKAVWASLNTIARNRAPFGA